MSWSVQKDWKWSGGCKEMEQWKNRSDLSRLSSFQLAKHAWSIMWASLNWGALNKEYQRKVILEDLSFTVERELSGLDWTKRSWENNSDELSAGGYEGDFWNYWSRGKAPGHPQLKASISYLPQRECHRAKASRCEELIQFLSLHLSQPFNGQWHRWFVRFTPEQSN